MHLGKQRNESKHLSSRFSFVSRTRDHPVSSMETGRLGACWMTCCDPGHIWTEFKGDRGTKSKPIPGPHNVYGFLTTAPNAVVEPIHSKAMPHDYLHDTSPARLTSIYRALRVALRLI